MKFFLLFPPHEKGHLLLIRYQRGGGVTMNPILALFLVYSAKTVTWDFMFALQSVPET